MTSKTGLVRSLALPGHCGRDLGNMPPFAMHSALPFQQTEPRRVVPRKRIRLELACLQ